MAMVKGVRKGIELPPSVFVAVDGETLEVLDTAQLPELAATPHGITTFDGRIAIYTCATDARVPLLLGPGRQEAVARRVVEGGLPEGGSDPPATPRDHRRLDRDPDQRHRRPRCRRASSRSTSTIRRGRPRSSPFGPLKKLQMSLAPPKTCIDLENDMLYSADAGVGKVAGIRLDQADAAR